MFLACITINILDLFIILDMYDISYYSNKKIRNLLLYFNSFSYHAAFFNIIYNNLFILSINYIYLIYVKSLDRGIFELFGPFGLFIFFRNINFYYKNLYFVFLSLTLYIIFIVIILFMLLFLLFNLSNILLLCPLLLINSFFLIIILFICDYYIYKKN